MSEVVVGLLGFACIVAIVVTLFKSKTLPSIAFIIFPMILGAILVFGGYYSWENIGKLIKSGFSSTGPTAALFVFSVLYFGIMTDAGMFDVIINNHAGPALTMCSTLMAAAVLGRHLPLVIGILSVPLALAFDTDSYFYGMLPVMIGIGEGFGIIPV